MIRLLHTADWHLGAALHGWSREPEHRAALGQLAEIARRRAVNAIIVAGDIFDSLNPSAEAQRLFFDTLRDLRAACPSAAIALIAGNHDPAGRLEAPRALFEFAGVHSIGVVARANGAFDPFAHLVPVKDDAGAPAAHILAMPYPRAADLPVAGADVPGSPVIWGVRELYRDAIAAVRREIGDGPLILTGHLHVAGGLESEGAERRILIGGEHAAPPDIFPADVAYVALGHLHRPQKIGRETIRYSGSLIPMSKTEIDYPHGVTVVDIAASREPSIDHIPLARSVIHRRLPARGALAPQEIADALSEFCAGIAPDAPWPFIYLAVSLEGPATGLKAEIDALLEKFPVRLASLSIERPRLEPAQLTDAVRLADCAPREIFAAAFAHAHGVEPTPAHYQCFDQLSQDA